MRYKWKRSYWVLIVSSCFVQVAVAGEEGRSWLLCQPSSYNENEKTLHTQYNEDVRTGNCILGTPDKNILFGMNKGVDALEMLSGLTMKNSSGTLVRKIQGLESKSGGNAVQNAQRRSIPVLKSPELIFVKNGARLENFVLDHNGKAYISNDGEIDSPGQSINNTVRNGAEIYVYAGGLSENSKIEQGGTENVQALKGKQGFSKNAVVKEGGQQSVGNGGKVEGTKIYGGEQLVFGEGDVGGQIKGSSASNTVIYGQGETLGQQKIYDGGITWNTKVMRGGVQEIAKKTQSAKKWWFCF